jgi:hypothetical protein
MCDEYSEAHVRAYWRAIVQDSELEEDEKKEEETIRPLGIELPSTPKAKPKTLLR